MRHTAPGWDPRLVVELHRVHALVVEADLHLLVRDRYLAAQDAARRTAQLAFLLRTGRAARPDPWLALGRVAPELGEWTSYFAALQPRCEAIQQRRLAPTEREADDLVRDAERFWDAVAGLRPRRRTVTGEIRSLPFAAADPELRGAG